MNNCNCPYCNSKISYWDKLKPAFSFGEQFVLCRNCHKKISEHWVNKGIGVGWVVGVIAFVNVAAQSDNPFAYFLVFIAVIMMIFMLAATKVKLKQCDELTFKEVRSEYMAKETSVNIVRVLIILVIAISGFAFFMWALSNGYIR